MTTEYKKWVRWNKVCRLICWTLEVMLVVAFISMAVTIGQKNKQIHKLEKQIENYECIR